MLITVTIWYLLITPIPPADLQSPWASSFKSFEVESVEFASAADCRAYATINVQARLLEKYPADSFPGVTSVSNCFSREKKMKQP